MRGWIFDTQKNKTFDTVYLVLKKEESYYKIALDKEPRPDVAHNKQLNTSGFTAKLINLHMLPKGIYTYLFAVSLDDNVTFVDIDNKLKI